MHDHRATAFPDPEHDHGSCLEDTLARAEEIFAARGLRLTPLRRRVLEQIASSHTAVGAYDILERLAKPGERRLAPISVYRALDSLVESGLVHRLESRNAFFACHTPHAGDRRQVVLACETCGAVAEMASDAVFDGIAKISRKAGFVPARTMVEVIGTCARCADSASGATPNG
jgi:Fur family transcriptional regulator, zinc uptake regulator